jgi:hypothetical protein
MGDAVNSKICVALAKRRLTGMKYDAVQLLFRWRSDRNTRNFLPLGIDCGREFIHLLEEHRDFPDLLVLQRGGKARHRRETDSMLHLPERRGLGIIFDSIFGKLRRLDIEALSQVRRLAVRRAMTYSAIFAVEVHADDQILIARLNGTTEPSSIALDRGVQRRVCNPAFQGGGSTIGVRRYEACFNGKISGAGQHDQCENYATEETYDRFHCFRCSASTDRRQRVLSLLASRIELKYAAAPLDQLGTLCTSVISKV